MAKVVGTMYEPYDCGSVNCFPNGIRPSYDAVPAPVTRPTWKTRNDFFHPGLRQVHSANTLVLCTSAEPLTRPDTGRECSVSAPGFRPDRLTFECVRTFVGGSMNEADLDRWRSRREIDSVDFPTPGRRNGASNDHCDPPQLSAQAGMDSPGQDATRHRL